MNEAASGREALLIRAFVELADTLVDDYDIIDLIDRLAGYCVELLAADSAGILLADARRDLRVVASTNEQTEASVAGSGGRLSPPSAGSIAPEPAA